MKKYLFLFIFPLILNSCFEEQMPDGYFDGSVWTYFEAGNEYDEDKALVSSFIDTHTLILSRETFQHVIQRIEKKVDSKGYEDAGETKYEGSYSMHYPDITLNYPAGDKQGDISISNLTLYYNLSTGQVLQFYRQTSQE
jgi:hypothetical protein